MNAGTLKIDRTVNLNTIIALGGFLLTIAIVIFTTGVSYTKIQAQAEAQSSAWTEFQKRQEDYNTRLDTSRAASRAIYDAKLDTVAQTLSKTSSIIDQQTYQLAQLQTKDQETDARLGRMTESYGDKFTEIQSSLADIKTQLALLSQSQSELKQIIAPPLRMPKP